MTGHENDRQQYPHEYAYRDDEVPLIDYLRVIWKWKVVIVMTVIMCMGLAAGIMIIKNPTQYVTTCIVSLNFPGIEKYENPDGTQFDKEQLITPVLLSRVYESLRQDIEDIKPGKLRGMLNVTSLIPPEIRARMEDAKKKNETYAFFPNQFVISLKTMGQRIITNNERSKILNAVIDEYRKSFERKYGEEPLVSINFQDNFIEQYDYPEILSIFRIKIDNLLQFLNLKIEKSGFYRDAETGASFIDVRDEIEILKNVELSNLSANIDTLGLVKDKENQINQYKYKIREIEVLERKKEKEAEVAKRLLKTAGGDGRYSLSRGSQGKDALGNANLVIDSSFIENLVKNDYYSYLLKHALSAEIAAKNLEVDKEYLRTKMTDLLNRDKRNDGEQNKITPALNSSLSRILDKLQSSAQKANDLNRRYLKSIITGVIRVIQEPETGAVRSINIAKRVVLVGMIALFCVGFIEFFIEYIRNVQAPKRTNR